MSLIPQDIKGRKRKRILQDTPVDLRKMRMARNRLLALKEELADIKETEVQTKSLMEHLDPLEDILNTAKKPKISFSSVSQGDLNKLGIFKERIVFFPTGLDDLVNAMSQHARDESEKLRERIVEIYDHVNMDLDVAIFPDMRLATGEGAQIDNPASQYKMWLAGNVNYAIITYLDILDDKGRLLAPDASRNFAFEIAEGHLFLVEAKQPSEKLSSYMPEAVSQALALAKLMDRLEVRFCLSNGQTWMSCVLKRDDNRNKWTSYESIPFYLTKSIVEQPSSSALQEIMQLVSEWLAPTRSGLYQLIGTSPSVGSHEEKA